MLIVLEDSTGSPHSRQGSSKTSFGVQLLGRGSRIPRQSPPLLLSQGTVSNNSPACGAFIASLALPRVHVALVWVSRLRGDGWLTQIAAVLARCRLCPPGTFGMRKAAAYDGAAGFSAVVAASSCAATDVPHTTTDPPLQVGEAAGRKGSGLLR